MIACKDCKHFCMDWGYKCHHPQMMIEDPIQGQLPRDCGAARRGALCGEEAKLFESKPPIARDWRTIIWGSMMVLGFGLVVLAGIIRVN